MMNNLYTLMLLFLFIFCSGLNCHNRPAQVTESAEKPKIDCKRATTWNDIKIQSAEIDSNLQIISGICSTFEARTGKKKIPTRQLIELINHGGLQRTFIFNDTTLQK